MAAYDLYTHAKSLIDTFAVNIRAKDDLLKAVRLLDEAVALDSNFLLAYCRLASAHGLLYVLGFDHTTARLALADAAVKNSLRISPESGEARFALAENYYLCQLDYDRALAELAAAQKSLPNDARVFALRGFIFRRQGRDEEGVQNLARAIQFDPRNVARLQQLAISYEMLHRYVDLAATLERALVISPDDIETKGERAIVD